MSANAAKSGSPAAAAEACPCDPRVSSTSRFAQPSAAAFALALKEEDGVRVLLLLLCMFDSSRFSLSLQIIAGLRPDGISFHVESVKSDCDGLTYTTRDHKASKAFPAGNRRQVQGAKHSISLSCKQ